MSTPAPDISRHRRRPTPVDSAPVLDHRVHGRARHQCLRDEPTLLLLRPAPARRRCKSARLAVSDAPFRMCLILPRGYDDDRSPGRSWQASISGARRHERSVHLLSEHPERIGAPARDHSVVPGGAEGRGRTARCHSTTSMANQVSSSAATFLVEAEVWRAISSKWSRGVTSTTALPMPCTPALPSSLSFAAPKNRPPFSCV